MRLTTRQLAPALAAVFYGVIFTLGQALHYLPGMDHFDGSSPQGSCCCALHCNQSTLAHDGKEQGGQTEDAPHDCPICELLALAQDQAVYNPAILQGEHLAEVAFESPLTASAQPFNLYSARGPPQRTLTRV